MSRLLAQSAMAIIVLTAANASADSIWNHNGSQMRLRAEGDRRTFVYEVPRAGIASQGVQRGTVLFEGTIAGESGEYSGTAYIFSTRCGKITYGVEGELVNDGTQILMRGSAPQRDTSTCVVKGYRDDRLTFDFVRSDEPPVKFAAWKEGEICAVEQPDEYQACLEGQANQVCKGRKEFEDLVRCFRGAVRVVYSKSLMRGNADVIVDTPFTRCANGVCSMWGGGPAPGCVRLDAQRIRECDGNVLNERCIEVPCPVRRCRKVCGAP